MLKVIFKVAAICCVLFFVVYYLTDGQGFSSLSSDDEPMEESDDSDDESANLPDSDEDAQCSAVADGSPEAASDHLCFKGVPIDGSLTAFVRNMKAKGFAIESSADGYAVLVGDFAGFKECVVGVSTLDGQDLVAGISVRFPSRDKWGELFDDYTALKDLLTEKYGKPASCVEKFARDIHIGGLSDYDKKLKLELDKCTYETVFRPANGTVTLKLDHHSVTKCFVRLTYADRQNSASVRQRAIDDL
ncbi:MAG: hypothetical protein ACI35Q_04295 [Marinilabiliaceae bacterium]